MIGYDNSQSCVTFFTASKSIYRHVQSCSPYHIRKFKIHAIQMDSVRNIQPKVTLCHFVVLQTPSWETKKIHWQVKYRPQLPPSPNQRIVISIPCAKLSNETRLSRIFDCTPLSGWRSNDTLLKKKIPHVSVVQWSRCHSCKYLRFWIPTHS